MSESKIFTPTAAELKTILEQHKKWRGSGGAEGARANLADANLARANLARAKIQLTTILDTGETWKQYLEEVVPALLTAGGKTVEQIVSAGAWKCHSWDNCPMAEAFSIHDAEKAPLLLQPRVRQFIRLFDSGLIPEPKP
jgi:hypothetical protein